MSCSTYTLLAVQYIGSGSRGGWARDDGTVIIAGSYRFQFQMLRRIERDAQDQPYSVYVRVVRR